MVEDGWTVAGAAGEDRKRTYALKMQMEAYLRRLEGDRRVRRGMTDRIIRRVIG